MEARRAQDRLQQEVSENERALQEDRLRGFQEIESMKRNHEFFTDLFPRAKLDEHPNTINNLMNNVQELKYEINCMHDSKDFKDAASMHSCLLSHVPSESALFPPQDDQGGLLGRAKSMPPNIWDTQCTSGNVICILRLSLPEYPHHGPIQMQVEFLGGPVRGNLYLEMAMEAKTQYLLRDF